MKGAVEETCAHLKEAFPEPQMKRYGGKLLSGNALPEPLLTCAVPGGTLLHMAASTPHTSRDTLLWLMGSGFDPNTFCKQSRNTPIGMTAYIGQPGHLRTFIEAGCDPVLRLSKRDGGGALAGTDLLWRVIDRDTGDRPWMADVVTVLLEAGLDPTETNSEERSALSIAREPIRELIVAWQLEQQLQQQTAPVAGSRPYGLRL